MFDDRNFAFKQCVVQLFLVTFYYTHFYSSLSVTVVSVLKFHM